MMNKKGFTLIEILITLGIFSLVALTGLNVFFGGFRGQNTTSLQVKVMQETQDVMDSIVELVRNNKIDYEEYFSQCVIQGGCPIVNDEVENEEAFYGLNHGYYAWQFFDGGFQDFAEDNSDGFGNRCQNSEGKIIKLTAETIGDCVTGILEIAEDTNTGSNPSTTSVDVEFLAANATKASAFCADGAWQMFGEDEDEDKGIKTGVSGRECVNEVASERVSELYLINPDGSRKTIIGRGKTVNKHNDFSVSKLELVAAEMDDEVENEEAEEDDIELEDVFDFKYPVKVFSCAEGYNCLIETKDVVTTEEVEALDEKRPMVKRESLVGGTADMYDDFIPLTPVSVNVKRLEFWIHGVEDPAKAFQEPNLKHPSVTIILEVEPANDYKLPFFSKSFNLRLQTTVSTAKS